MPIEPVQPPSHVLASEPAVFLEADRLLINELDVDGAAFEAAREAVAQGRDLELTVRQMLEVGGAVLLHGASKATVDAVAAEVERLMAVFDERADGARRLRAERERGHLKGFDFEDLLAPIIDDAYAPHQDVVEHVGTTRGVADNLCGDFVACLNPADTGGRDRRIVFEAKDARLSVDKALAELDAAMLNREAQVGVLVFASPAQAPVPGRPLRVLPGNRILVIHDKREQDGLALEVACQLARSIAMAAQGGDVGLDRGRLSEELTRLVSTIERAKGVQRGLNAARRSIDGAEKAYGEMRDEALAVLYQLQDEL